MRRLTPSREKRRIAEQTTSFHQAAVRNQTDFTVQLFEEDPSQLDARDHFERTPLHRACGRGHHGTASVLLALGANVQAQDKHGQVPLHYAVFAGCSVTVEVLLGMGADPKVADKNGRTPAHIAVAKGADAILRRLIDSGAVDPGMEWPGPGKKWSLKTFWSDDLEADECMCCRERVFSVQNRRHHCRQCGDVICRNCAVKAKPPWHTPTEKSELVCKTCTKVWATEDKSKGVYTSKGFADKSELLERELQEDDFEELNAYYWFYAGWTRVDAEAALEREGVLPGDFVCRPSSYPDSVALSVVAMAVSEGHPDVQHFLIQYYNEGWFLKVPSATGRYTSFDTVVELLRYHIRNGIELPTRTLHLKRPHVSLDDVPLRQQRGDMLTTRRPPPANGTPNGKAGGDAEESLPQRVGSVDYGVATSPVSDRRDMGGFVTPPPATAAAGAAGGSNPAALSRQDSLIAFVPESPVPGAGSGGDLGGNGWMGQSPGPNGSHTPPNGAATRRTSHPRDVWAQAATTSPIIEEDEEAGAGPAHLSIVSPSNGVPEASTAAVDADADADGYDSGSYYDGSSDEDGPGPDAAQPSGRRFVWTWRVEDLVPPPPPPEVDRTPPEFPEPVFDRSNIPEVDEKIRSGILDQFRATWEAELALREADRQEAMAAAHAHLEIRRHVAATEIAAAADASLALDSRESLAGLAEVFEAVDVYSGAVPSAPAVLTEGAVAWRAERERRVAAADAELAEALAEHLESGRAALEEAQRCQAAETPVELDTLSRASSDLEEFRRANDPYLSESTRGTIAAALAEWADAESALSEWEIAREATEKAQARAATVIQAGARGMAVRNATRAALAELAARRAEAAAARAVEREALAAEWAVAEAEADREARREAMRATVAAAAALPPLTLPDRALTEMVAGWTEVIEAMEREDRIEAEADRVHEIVKRGQAAFLVPAELEGLRAAVADAQECEPTDELKMYLAIWSKAVASREEQQQTQQVLERGYAAVQKRSTDPTTADTLAECIALARSLPENEILSGAIATWERTVADLRAASTSPSTPSKGGLSPGSGVKRAGSRPSPSGRRRNAWTEKDALFDLERDVAEECLRHRDLDNGHFILRESSSVKGQFTLSVRLMDVVKHYRVNVVKSGQYTLRGSDLTFRTLTALLHNYSSPATNDILPTALRGPCPKNIVDGVLAQQKVRLCGKCSLRGKPNDEFCLHCGAAYPVAVAKLLLPSAPRINSWELQRDRVELHGMLGTGNFGEVRQGLLGGKHAVAVKTSKADKMSTKTFLEEAENMKFLQHPNLCKLHGVCTLSDPVLIVLEHVGGGCLMDWLHSRRGRGMAITLQCKFLADVAAGMAYMQDRHWVHCDLAARNILVSASGTTLKICDFGHVTRCGLDDAPVTVTQQLPVRWSAPEFFRSRCCNPAVDVWSFGVVIFEVLTRAAEPYADIVENKVVIAKLEAGWRMPRMKPVHAPFYAMMLDCWNAVPADRPRFTHLHAVCAEWEGMGPLKQDFKGDLVDKTGTRLRYTSGIVCGDTVPTPPDPDVARPPGRKKPANKNLPAK